MQKKYQKTIILSLVLIVFFSFSGLARATGDYTVLAPLPGIGETTGNKIPTDLGGYLKSVFNLAIGLGAVLAFVMITFGGFTYATSDAITGKAQGREYIENAVWGLLLVIGAWAILYTINPQILNFNLLIPSPTTTGTSSSATSGTAGILPGYSLTAAQIALDTSMRTDLKNNYHIDVNNGPCTDPAVTKGCTNIVGLPDNAFRGVVDIKNSCNCAVTITGGTEGGHKEHGPNQPVFDLGDNQALANYINTNKVGTPVQTDLGPVYTLIVGGRTMTFLQETDGGAHWHVVVK